MKVVLFDLDGTLVKAGGSGRKALNRAVKTLHGVDEICSRFVINGRMDKENFHLAFLKAVRRKPKRHEAQAIHDLYLKYLPHEVRRAMREKKYQEIPGISALIRRLAKRKDVLLGLGTGNIERGAQIKLKPSGLHRYFSFGGFGADSMSRAAMLRKAVRRAEKLAHVSIDPRNVFVIGDTHKDILAGKKAGYRTGVVLDGFGELAKIRKAKPELSAPDFRNTRLWLNWIWGTGTKLISGTRIR